MSRQPSEVIGWTQPVAGIACLLKLANFVSAIEDGYKFEEKFPMTHFVVLDKLRLQMCFLECEVYGACLSINYNRKQLVCELNSGWKYILFFLFGFIKDRHYVFEQVPRPVSFFYSVCFQRPKNQSDYWTRRLGKHLHNLASDFDTNTKFKDYHLQWDQNVIISL